MVAGVDVEDRPGHARGHRREQIQARLADIVKVTVYLIDIRYREPVYRVLGRWLKGVYPVSTGIVVAGLARPEWLVEVDVIAVIPDAAANP